MDNISGKLKCSDGLEESIIKQCHDYLGHPGEQALYKTLLPYFDLPRIKYLCQKVRKECQDCQRCAIRRITKNAYIPNLESDTPFQDLCTDITGPFESSHFPQMQKNKKFWIITLLDRCTRLAKIKLTYKISSQKIILAIKNWIKSYGKFKTLLSDQGKQYISSEFQNWLKAMEITPILCTTYSPTSNGMAERINQAIAFGLKHFKNENVNAIIEKIENKLNSCYHRKLGCAPIEFANQLHPLNFMKIRREFKAQNKSKANFENTLLSSSFKLGDIVYKKNFQSGKLEDHWQGPYKIVKIYPNQLTYDIENNLKKLRVNYRQIRLE